MTYAAAGVDIEAGDAVVDRIKPVLKRTHGPRVMGLHGAFAGMFRLDYNESLFKRNYKDPVLVACTDGVGTKVMLAIEMGRLDTIGIDCVAMNVNDLIVQGAEPLFFLDYLGLSKVDPADTADIIASVAKGCEISGCALIGGECAEMPDIYKPGDFDVAGFAVGVVELARANAMGVMLDQPESLSAFGLDDPLALVEIVEKDGRSRKLMIGDRVGGRTQDRYAMIEGIPSVMRIEARILAAILEDPIGLVDPRATGISSTSVKSIIIRSPGQEIALERDLDRWLATSHDDVEVPADRVEALIELLTDIPGSEVAIMDEYPRNLEVGTITLVGYDQRPLDTVRVLRETPEDGLRWGLENGDGVIRIHPTLLNVPLVDRDWGLRRETP